MKKQLSTILRSWADWLYHEQNSIEINRPIKIDLFEHKPQKIAILQKIDKKYVEERLLGLKGQDLEAKREAVITWYIADAKICVEGCMIKTIKDKDLIEFDIDREDVTVCSELKIWTK
jgi:hypothetical protein